MPKSDPVVIPFRQLRRLKGFDSDKQVAERAGMSRAHLSLALTGRTNLRDHMVSALARVLGVSEEAIVLAIRSEVSLARVRRAQ